MKRIISIVLTLLMLISMTTVAFVSTKAATEILPFSSEATMVEIMSGYSGSDKVSATTLYKIDGSGTTTVRKLVGGEHPDESAPDTPYINQGAVGINGDYYFTAIYKRDFGYEHGYIYKYDTSEEKFYVSDALPIAHSNDACYNADINRIMICCYDPHPERIALVNPDDLTYDGYITLKDENGETLYPYAFDYDAVNKRYYACCFDEGWVGGYDYVLDENFNVIKKLVRDDGVNLNTNKYPYYLNQGMCIAGDYVLKVYAGKTSSAYENHKIAVCDWDGNLIQLVNDPTDIELEDIFYDQGKFHFVYHSRSGGGRISEARMAMWTNKYYSNGGTGTMADSIHYSGTTKALSKNTFKKSGYSFSGWNVSRKSDGKHIYSTQGDNSVREWYTPGEQPEDYYRYYYTDGKNVSYLSGALFDEVYLTARWVPESNLYIEYDPNGGEGRMEMTEFEDGACVTLPENTITRKGYKFKGWAIRRKDDERWRYINSSGTKKWAYTKPSGYDYQLYVPGETTNSLGVSRELVCMWEKVDGYTVKFNSNGGTGTMEDLAVEIGATETLPANTFTKEGYTFVGWKAPDGKTYSDEAAIKNLTSADKTVTLTAQWTANTYTVKFDANGGEGEMTDMSMTYDEAENLTANQFTKTGYTFAGWTYDGKTYGNKTEVVNLTAENEATVTLTAKWTANTYTVKFASNGGEGEMADMSMTYDEAQKLTANQFTKTGYTFAGWSYDGNTYVDEAEVKNLAVSGEVTLTAQWTANTYTVKFDSNGGTGTMSDMSMTYDEAENLTANQFTKTGYTFAGWSYDGNTYVDEAEVENLAVSGDVTLIAQWTANTYTVKFDANGGEGEMADMSMTYDEAENLTANTFKKTGYTFAGWTYGENTYVDEAEVKNLAASGEVTLTAQWEPITYTIKFVANGGTGEMETMTVKYGETVNLTANGFTKKISKFTNWTTADGTVYADTAEISNLTATDGEEIVLTAQWMTYSDVNNDGLINVMDISTIQLSVIRKIRLTADQKVAADVNGDGVVNVLDISTIQMYIIRKIRDFPVCQ